MLNKYDQLIEMIRDLNKYNINSFCDLGTEYTTYIDKGIEKSISISINENKLMLICLKDSKKGNFTKGKIYIGVNFNNSNYRLIGNDNKSHLMRKERFILIKGE